MNQRQALCSPFAFVCKLWLYAACLLLSLASFGCQSALGGGVSAFHRADYPQAARELRIAHAEGLAGSEAPRFELYSGLTQLALGNARLAVEHLTRARATLDADPTYFSNDERARLLSAWRALGRMPGQPLLVSR